MAAIVADASCDGEGESRDQSPASRSQKRDLDLLAMLTRARIECDYSVDALAAAMGFTNHAHVSKVLAGDKPLGASFLLALPDDVAAVFTSYYAEAYGQVVVRPVRGEDAVRQFAAGLIGIFAQAAQGALTKSPMLKAGLPPQAKRKVG